MKKVAVVLAFLILFSLCGCQNVVNRNKPMYPVYDINGNEIAGVEMQARSIVLLDDGFVYSAMDDRENNVWYMSYYRYYFKNKKTVKLGFVPNYAGQSGRTAILNGHLYILVITGNKGEFKNSLNLMEINLNNNKMKVISDGAIAGNVQMYNGGYLSSTIAIDRSDEKHPRILILKQNIDTDEFDPTADSVQFDPETGKSSETRLSDILKAWQNSGITTKAMYVNGNAVNILQADSKKSSVSVMSYPLVPTGKDPLGNDTYNDKKLFDTQVISNAVHSASSEFYIFGKFVFYMSDFNSVMEVPKLFFGVINDGKLEETMKTGSDFYLAPDASQSETEAVFYDTASNSVYYLNLNAADGEKLQKAVFDPGDGSKLSGVQKSPDGHLLIQVWKRIDARSTETRYYYIKLSDLDFSESVDLLN